MVLVTFVQADDVMKKRPAIFLREMPPYHDVLVCGISTQLNQQVKDFDEIISHADADFAASGLLADSLIRLGFLSVLPQKDIEGSIGFISQKRHSRLLQTLSNYLIEKRR